MAELMKNLSATGVSLDHIEQFLRADPHGSGSFEDRLATEMANDLLAAFGRPPTQTIDEIKRLRRRGAWMHLGQRPPE